MLRSNDNNHWVVKKKKISVGFLCFGVTLWFVHLVWGSNWHNIVNFKEEALRRQREQEEAHRRQKEEEERMAQEEALRRLEERRREEEERKKREEFLRKQVRVQNRV